MILSFELDDLVGKKNVAMTEECLAFFSSLFFFFKKENPKHHPPTPQLERVSFLQIIPFSATFVLPKTCSLEATGEMQRELHNK